jgi:hypothetical protein
MKHDITFTVESTTAQRPYGDTYKTYIVESTQSIHVIQAYCTKILCPAISREEFKALPTDGEDFGNHFITHYTELLVLHEVKFPDDGKNKVSYKCTQPSTC